MYLTTKQKVIFLDIVIVTVWIMILFFFAPIHKTEVIFLDINPFYSSTLLTLYFFMLLYAHFFTTKISLLNYIVTTIIFSLALILSIKSVDGFMTLLTKLDQNKTPLGWAFRYRWIDFFLTNLFTLILLELRSKIYSSK